MKDLTYYLQRKGYLFFQIGVFLIVSAPSIASIFIFLSLIGSHQNDSKSFIDTRWIFPFFIASFFAICSAFFSTFREEELNNLSKSYSWVGLVNWIPFFFVFIASQKYLSNINQRKTFSKFLIAGTFPLFVSCVIGNGIPAFLFTKAQT